MSRVSIPGAPFGIFEKSSFPSSFCSFIQKLQWSVETACSASVLSPFHKRSSFPLGRQGPRGWGWWEGRVDPPPFLCVHAAHPAVLLGAQQGSEDGGIVHHEDPRVGHEELEAGDAFTNQGVHFLEMRFLG